jgi:hypothetical protein
VTDSEHPWERLPEESEKWWERFDHYRLQGPARTLEAAWRAGAKSSKKQRPPGSWYEAARKYRWKERAAAWDAAQRTERQRQRQEQIEQEQEAFRKKRIILGEFAWGLGFKGLKDKNPRSIKTADAIKLIEAGVKLQREALAEGAEATLSARLAELERRLIEHGITPP